ncbi:MAG TPA: DUF4149 domain-containing protein [Blastocatellia bacterium]|nr:DUF4149 domain-containing protein [Blastocatellia bacterium]
MSIEVRNTETVKTAPGADSGVGTQILVFAEALLLSIWLGSMVFFSFAVAPSAFGVLPSRHLAGQVVASTIAKVEMIGLAAGALLLALQLTLWRTGQANRRIRAARMLSLIVMILATAGMRFWISPTMVALRASMGRPIDEIDPADPLRTQFNDLHQYSVILMAIAMLAGVVFLFLSVKSWLRR